MLCRALPIIRATRAGIVGMLAFIAIAMPAAGWERPHGDGANLNFENVATSPAATASQTVSGLGTIPLGAGPVIAPDGTVYIANTEGEVIALHADGTPYWRRKLYERQSIVASPVIGSDGTVYVVGTSHATDHRVDPPAIVFSSSLHRFTASGGYIGSTAFPQHDLGGAAVAPPNIWRYQGQEMVVVPATYKRKLISTFDVRLIGFDPAGPVVADQIVTSVNPDMFGGNGLPAWQNVLCGLTLGAGCMLGVPFERTGELPSAPDGAGVFTYAGGGTPFVVIADGLHDVVGYTFSAGAFVESFRVHDDDLFMSSAPTILPDGHTVMGIGNVKFANNGAPFASGGGAIFTGPNFNKVAPVKGLGAVYAAPTRLPDGRVLLLDGSGGLAVLQNNQIADKLEVPGTSIVSPVASQTHVFISTSEALITLDAGSLAEVARVGWNGGQSQPAIGPKGHVYAISGNTLFVFPPARQLPPNRTIPESAPTAVSTAGADTKPYKPPLTMNGNRLFACEELDGDNCGKGDYQTIADAFCKKEGFIGSGHILVDSKKVKAETLDGRYCSKKKCKVFEQIVCANN